MPPPWKADSDPGFHTFAHGLNEKLPASEVEAGLEFWHRVLVQLAK